MSAKNAIKRIIPRQAFKVSEPYYHWAEAVLAQKKYNYPANKLKVVGVTGTDGKTTTCSLIAAMLRNSGHKVAVITTTSVDYGDGKGEQVNPTQLTTGSAKQLNKIIALINKNNVEYLVLEVSSHALNQRRVWGIPFYLVVHTNMSHEHLDYHGTFDNYRKAKERLFKLCNANKKGLRTGIINVDDATAKYFAKDILHPITYSRKNGDLVAKNIKSTLAGNTYDAVSKTAIYHIKSFLAGEFNVYNTLATVAVGQAIGLNQEQIEQGIASLPFVSGRMMPIDEGQNFKVFIDYAVTPAALENVLSTVRHLSKNSQIHIVFGATGDRDKTKRPIMGEVTAKLADFVYLTDDETYTEDPEFIRQSVYKGVKPKDQSKVTMFDDRKNAISAALKNAKAGDVVLITGIGHQTSRKMGGKKTSWSDIEVAQELLKNIRK